MPYETAPLSLPMFKSWFNPTLNSGIPVLGDDASVPGYPCIRYDAINTIHAKKKRKLAAHNKNASFCCLARKMERGRLRNLVAAGGFGGIVAAALSRHTARAPTESLGSSPSRGMCVHLAATLPHACGCTRVYRRMVSPHAPCKKDFIWMHPSISIRCTLPFASNKTVSRSSKSTKISFLPLLPLPPNRNEMGLSFLEADAVFFCFLSLPRSVQRRNGVVCVIIGANPCCQHRPPADKAIGLAVAMREQERGRGQQQQGSTASRTQRLLCAQRIWFGSCSRARLTATVCEAAVAPFRTRICLLTRTHVR